MNSSNGFFDLRQYTPSSVFNAINNVGDFVFNAYNNLMNPTYELDYEADALNIGLSPCIMSIKNIGRSGTLEFIRKNGKFTLYLEDEKLRAPIERYLSLNPRLGVTVCMVVADESVDPRNITRTNENGSIGVTVLAKVSETNYIWNMPEAIGSPSGVDSVKPGFLVEPEDYLTS